MTRHERHLEKEKDEMKKIASARQAKEGPRLGRVSGLVVLNK